MVRGLRENMGNMRCGCFFRWFRQRGARSGRRWQASGGKTLGGSGFPVYDYCVIRSRSILLDVSVWYVGRVGIVTESQERPDLTYLDSTCNGFLLFEQDKSLRDGDLALQQGQQHILRPSYSQRTGPREGLGRYDACVESRQK